MVVALVLTLPIALTIAWGGLWFLVRRVTPWFFVHAVTACLCCLVLAVLLDKFYPSDGPLGSNAFIFFLFNALTGFVWTLVLALATAVIAGVRGSSRSGGITQRPHD